MNTLEHVYDCVEAIPWVGLEVGDVLRVRPGAVLWSREGQPGGSLLATLPRVPALIFEGAACRVKPDGSLRYEATFLPALLYVLVLEPWAVRARGNSLPPGTLWERRVDRFPRTYASDPAKPTLTLIRGGADQ